MYLNTNKNVSSKDFSYFVVLKLKHIIRRYLKLS